METRNISLTLEKAKEWYNSDSTELKEVALQAYTENELKTKTFKDITTFADAVRALGIDITDVECNVNGIKRLYADKGIKKHLIAVYKLDIIRKALNKDWKPSLIEGSVYYPYVRFYPANKAKENAKSDYWVTRESFRVDEKKYTLVGGDHGYYLYVGLANYSYAYGVAMPALGLLGCENREIAEHMSRYFAKEIFEAVYAQHVGTYKWSY